MKEKITALFREIRRKIRHVRYGYHALKTDWVYHEHDDFSFFAPCAARNIMQAIPEGLPAKGNKRSYVLGLVPDELKEKVVCSTWKYSIRW